MGTGRFATLVKEHPYRAATPVVRPGPAALYKLSDPYPWDDERPPCDFVFVSTASVMGEPETYAFPADESGDCISWRELPGSEKGDTTHAAILANMGYELRAPDAPKGPCTE